MTSHPLNNGLQIDVAIIGGGPAGLAAATSVKNAGVARVVLLERETEAGGIPRHCGHPPFGMREFKRILRGPAYARRLVERARRAGVEICTSASVVKVLSGGELLVATPDRLGKLRARRVIYATGVRETPRSARLISGARVQGVMNTGALQAMVYLKNRRPFHRPVVIGSELVAFSAIMTCRRAGIQPAAMIESGGRVIARWPSSVYPPLAGVKLLTRTKMIEILGDKSVTGVMVEGPDGLQRRLDCDGVVLSGQFTPEATLARCGHLEIDPATGGPVVDQWGRCSDPAYFATGNLLRPVETAGWSWNEGRQTGEWVAEDLAGRLHFPKSELIIETADPRLKYTMPQKIALPCTGQGMSDIQLRVSQDVSGELIVRNSQRKLWSRKIKLHPERRMLIPIEEIAKDGSTRIQVDILEN